MKQNIVKCGTVDFHNLIRNSKLEILENYESKFVKLLDETFTEDEQRWYVANMFMYLNYHPTNEYPINLEDVYKLIGFANKGNAMKTIKNNFTTEDDYKVRLFHTEKRKNEGGFNKEDVMLNVDTFKNLCMLAKTDKGERNKKILHKT